MKRLFLLLALVGMCTATPAAARERGQAVIFETDMGNDIDDAMALDLLVVPGDEFGCPGYVRLAYCVPKTMLERSLPRFRQLADQYGLKK